MKNADMAAMPTQSNGGDIFGGLTKREMIAMHFHAALLTSQAEGVWTGIGVNAAFHAVQEADELLAELDRTCQKP